MKYSQMCLQTLAHNVLGQLDISATHLPMKATVGAEMSKSSVNSGQM